VGTAKSTGTPAAAATWPDADSLAAFRAWLEGVPTRTAVEQYLGSRRAIGTSSRGVISGIKRQLVNYAGGRGRPDLVELVRGSRPGAAKEVRRALAAIETLRVASAPTPMIGDDVERWLPARTCAALRAAGIRTLADLTLRVPRRRRWWASVPGLGAVGARHVEGFFAEHPALTERARALVTTTQPQELVPWERLAIPGAVDGSSGTFRAPRATCALSADNDYQAIQAWLSMHESDATRRAYRKEAERLILWAIVERSKALSSLSTEDAVAYRAFLRQPTPRMRWVGPARPRLSAEWRPFAGALSSRSIAYSLSVLNALYRWLIEQRYLLVNPFAGLKVRGVRPGGLDAGRAFTEGEWGLIRTVADGLEWSYGWSEGAAQRLRFVLDFAYATGLRSSELVGATLKQIECAHGEWWLRVVGKGNKAASVALPPLARGALNRYLVQRALPVTPTKWLAATPLIGNMEGEAAITSSRLWAVLKRFFGDAAAVIEEGNPAVAEKLRKASPHWMRHTHGTHLLNGGADLTTVRDNLRHSSISTTSTYLHSDDSRRAKQVGAQFQARS
jgi:site-specific recombinase XerD